MVHTMKAWPPGHRVRRYWGTLGLALLCTSAAAVPAQEHSDLKPSFSIIPELYATGFEFAEGPAFDQSGNLFVVNYRGNGNIGRITRAGQASVWCDLNKLAPSEGRRAQANGLKVDAEGALVVADAGAGRLLRITPDGKQVTILADRFQGQRLQSINDVAVLGPSIYFTDPGGSSEEKPIGSVYRYDSRTRAVTQLATGLAFPNGVAIAPDLKQICVSESRRYRVLIYDLLADGSFGAQRVLIEFPSEDRAGLRGGNFDPDGMAFDAKGRLYVAMWTGGFINVVDVPSGQLLRQYDAGGAQATNCHFYEDALYVTVAAHEAVYRLKLGVPGFQAR
ncbi:MAG: SMP-30/gluconolactonase/LRE family protein [Pirellulaceae bacterium]